MKKLILSVAVLVGISATNISFANDKGATTSSSAIELLSSNDLKFKLTLENVKSRSSMVIKDNDGTVVFSTTIPQSEKYTKIFDLSNLLDGNYNFVVNNGGEVISKPFTIATETKRSVVAVK